MSRILIADDESSIRFVLREALEGTGNEVEEARDAPGCGFGLRRVGIRKQMSEAGRGLHGRLGEAVIELAAPAAGDVDQQAVEDLSPGFVDVHAEMQKRAKKTSTLRLSFADDVACSSGQRIVGRAGVPQERRKVARCE